MGYYLTFCGGLFVGSLFCLLYLKKQLRDEFECKYGYDIEIYKKIIDDFNSEVALLKTDNNNLRSKLFGVTEDTFIEV